MIMKSMVEIVNKYVFMQDGGNFPRAPQSWRAAVRVSR